ncbi:MAG: phosphodiester glycosidase family protein [Clostridiaceae bacterium]|nr:phosphodiester glycosidase family protein [Clostridiaceae bacterium]
MKSRLKQPDHTTAVHRAGPQKPARRNLPLPLVILFDLLLVGAGLVIFALFHHVLPRDIKSSGIVLPRPSVTAAGASESGGATDSRASIIGDNISVSAGNTDMTTTSAAPAATSAASGAWGAKFAGRFTGGDIIKTDHSYQSAHISITLNRVQTGKVAYIAADIYLSDIDYFRTAFATGQYGRGLTGQVLDMAQENQAILAMSGDYYGIRDAGIVIRNGELYRETTFQDVLVMNYDGTMETVTAGDFNLDKVMQNGAWQAWSFGPMLLDNGQPMTRFNSSVTAANPRSAIGYYEPGHYCFVLVDGRQPGYSDGLTMTQLSQLFYDLGCKAAYNLDGGQSSVMTFMGQIANQPYHNGRRISDIVYIAEQ